MLSKKNIVKNIKFNFELEKAFSSETLYIQSNDIEKSLIAMSMLCEYIRFCYFDGYIFYNSKKLEKYCNLLLKYENCNQSVLVKECQNLCKKILSDAMNEPCSLKSVDLSFALNNSKYEFIYELCSELMTLSLGTKVRAINK